MTTTERDRSSDVPADGLLSLEDALAQMLDAVAPLGVERLALADCLGRVLAEPVTSRLTLPPWDNSAMDGFAVRSADLAGANEEQPLRLRVIGESAAGHPTHISVDEGECVRILTGAPLPSGADAVVPVEQTDAFGARAASDTVHVRVQPVPGAHIRRAGSDLRHGYPLLARGDLLDSADLAACAAGGHAELVVRLRPRVAVLATGDELVPPGAELGEAQIPDSNSIGLLAQAREAGADVLGLGIAGDSLEAVLALLRPALGWADCVVVSGGVSVGVHDVVKEAFAQLGRMELWRVAVQPGKPLAFARAPRGEREAGWSGERGTDVLLFGLPGNPVSSFVTFELFVRPVLRRLAGLPDGPDRQVVRARLAQRAAKSPGRRAFLRVRLEADESGGWRAELAGGQGSHVLSALVAADGLAVIPEEREEVEEGSEVEVIRLRQASAR